MDVCLDAGMENKMIEFTCSWCFSEEYVKWRDEQEGEAIYKGGGYTNGPQSLSDKRRQLLTKGNYWTKGKYTCVRGGENQSLSFRMISGSTWENKNRDRTLSEGRVLEW